MDDHLEANRAHWDEVVAPHRTGDFYDVEGFIAGKPRLDPLVREALGEIEGRKVLHLQCHFGLDTLDLARLGALPVGVDFSARAVEAARELAAETGLEARFVQAVVGEVQATLRETFELVFTSYGVLTWLPELTSWARDIAACLDPGGRVVVIDSHPTAMVFDDEVEDTELRVRYPYFEAAAMRFREQATYAVGGLALEHDVTYEWMHPIEEIVMSLLEAGLRLTVLREYPFAAWRMYPWLERGEDGFWRLPGGRRDIPLLLRVEAVKPK